MNDKRKISDIKSNENFSGTPVLSPHTSPMKRSEMLVLKDTCFMCNKIAQKVLVDCKICSVKGNN